MADWRVIDDDEVEPDAPLTSSLAFAWRDNPIAIAEGAPGAPRLRGSGAFDSEAGNTLIVPAFIVPSRSKSSGPGVGFVPGIQFMTVGAGSLRAWSNGQSVGGSGDQTFQIRVNDSVVLNVGIGGTPDATINFGRNQIIEIGTNFPSTDAGVFSGFTSFRLGASLMTLPIVRW